MGIFTQAHRLLHLYTPLGEEILVAEALSGHETIDNGGFGLALSALSEDAQLPLKSLMGQRVTLALQTAHSRDELRTFSGHITRAERVASNAGMARYQFIIEPWLAFLRWRTDSFLFQNLSVFDIAESIFADYQGQGSLRPQWRWDIEDRQRYPLRGITTQYLESDYQFLTRLFAEEGLYYWFEHQGQGLDAQHTLVIADHPQSFVPNAQAEIRYHRADATEDTDSITAFSGLRQLQTNSLGWQSWDYKSVDARPQALQSNALNSARAINMHWSDDPGLYAWETNDQGARLLQNAMQALEARNKIFAGQSSVRTLAPATTFSLQGHYALDNDSADDQSFAVIAVHHQARNNFDEDLGLAIRQAVGESEIARALALEFAPQVTPQLQGAHSAVQAALVDYQRGLEHASSARPEQLKTAATETAGNEQASVPYYRNQFSAIRSSIPYRPLVRDGQGRSLHPKPTVHGQQTAIVIGNADPIHSDRDHRIKVQFHWQRGSQSASRNAHPGGDDNAPANARLGAWLRMATAVAGDNWGQVSLPRVGQEVLVDFLNGDIDRPVVASAVYNGIGVENAQNNQKARGGSASTGNAPAWFAGTEGEHRHNAVYTGIKTQEMSTSQDGTGGFNHLVFDDTPSQPRLGLGTTQATSRLHLGHHKQQDDNLRGTDRGHGAELATKAQGAIRGGAGLLISAHQQTQAQGDFMESKVAQNQTERARELAQSLAESAQHQGAKLKDEVKPEELGPVKGLKHIAEVLKATQSGTGSSSGSVDAQNAIKATEGGDGEVGAYSEPHLQLSAPQGIAMLTPAEYLAVSGTDTSWIAQQDVNLLAQQQLALSVAKGISFYTVGKKPQNAEEPGANHGIQWHVAHGEFQLQSQSGPSRLTAEKRLTLASQTGEVKLHSPEEVLFTVAGAYVRLKGSNIEIHAPGKVTFRGQHQWPGPQGDSVDNTPASAAYQGCAMQENDAATSGAGSISR